MTTAKIAALIVKAETNYAVPCGSGAPWYRATAIINGHHVQANMILSEDGTEQSFIWVDKSSEKLTLEQAVQRVNA